MRRDVATMTRAELLANAKRFLIAGAVCVVLVVVVGELMTRDSNSSWWGIGMLVLLAGTIGSGMGLLGGSYYLLKGLLRPATWTPQLADWQLQGFSAEDEARRVTECVRKGVEAPIEAFEVSEVAVLGGDAPRDDRTPWEHFLDASEQVVARYLVHTRGRFAGRVIDMTVVVGRSMEDPEPVWVGLQLSSTAAVSAGGPVQYTAQGRRFNHEALDYDRELAKALDTLVRIEDTAGSKAIRTPASSLVVVPDGTTARVVCLTLPRQRLVRPRSLGIDEFLIILQRLEVLLPPPSA